MDLTEHSPGQTKLAGDEAEIYLLQWLVAAEKELRDAGPVSFTPAYLFRSTTKEHHFRNSSNRHRHSAKLL